MKESAKLVLLFQRKSTNVPLLQALFPIEVGGQWSSWATGHTVSGLGTHCRTPLHPGNEG